MMKERIKNKIALEKAKKDGALECNAKPIMMWLESTSRCNLKCIACPRPYLPFFKGKDINDKVFQIVMKELFPFIEKVHPQGFGEPMISEKFDIVFNEAIKNNTSFSFNTNGMYLTERWIRKFLKNNICFYLSMDGAREATLQKIRPGIDFGKIIQSIELFNILKETEYKGSQAAIHIMCVALKSNIEELPDLVSLAKELNILDVIIKQFSLSIIHPPRVYRESLRNHKEFANKYFLQAMRHAENLGVNLEVSLFNTSEKRTEEAQPCIQKCFAPWERILVRTNGDITPCCSSGMIMGNIMKEGFWKVWNGKKYRTFRKRIHSDLPPLDCRNCTIFWGINTGNAENRKSKEIFRQKLFYFFESKRKYLEYTYSYLRDYI